ncbi:MAG: NAD(P)H-hydrate dehydratase [Anaerolineae bacterium]|nr:NAD(P)H-hydrate dehydratase [Anaerolineae bacterium]
MKLVSVAEMRAMEQEANERGVSYGQMMITAGEGLAKIILKKSVSLKDKTALALVGSGNNGGDALVALVALSREQWHVTAYLVRPRPADDPLVLLLRNNGGDLVDTTTDADFHVLDKLLAGSAVLIDGVLGTGVKLPLRVDVARVLEHVKLFTPRPYTVAVDCPSGVDCDSGEAADETIPANITVCMEAVKQGLVALPAFGYAGKIIKVDLGLPVEMASQQDLHKYMVDADMVRAALPERRLDSHKGSFGTLMVVAGSVYYMGAALLAGKAAYRIGAGLVQMGVTSSLQTALVGSLPEATWVPLPDEDGCISREAINVLHNHLERTTCMLLGPGLATHESTAEFVNLLLTDPTVKTKQKESENNFPMVIDADGIRLLGQIPQWFKILPPGSILTPHPGEMAILTGYKVSDIQQNRFEIASDFSRRWGQVVVLKGALTVVAGPEGSVYVVPVATPALARAGTGDVLAGMIAGLLAQKVVSFKAAWIGAYLHGRAGVLAAKKLGSAASVLASDVSSCIAGALNELLTL